ncbi:hypothetical protein GF376_00590 [Candidatus Peregrinibacteria bacterium]|nr:hypothetical protein [Candidatus Peregrinibacteria bacterium]
MMEGFDHKKRIDDLVKGNRVMVFMKGTPEDPVGSENARAISLLEENEVQFMWMNVDDVYAMENALIDYFETNELPLVVVDGKMIGSTPSLQTMHDEGTLRFILG